MPRPKSAAYRNIKSHKYSIDGITFASRGEAERYLELDIQRLKGEVIELVLQPKFELQPKFRKNGKSIREISYIADFKVIYKDGKVEIEDVKGWGGYTTPEFKLKRKLFLFRYPQYDLILSKRNGKKIDVLLSGREALKRLQ
jgi:hypothetical protein